MSAPSVPQPSCPVTQLPIQRGCCTVVRIVRGRKCLLTLAVFGITTPHQKSDSPCLLASLELASTSHYPLLVVLFLAEEAFPQQVQVCGTWHLTFLNDEASWGGLLCRLGPEGDHQFAWPTIQGIWFKGKSWAFTSLPQTTQREMELFYFPTPAYSKHITWEGTYFRWF